MGWTNDAIEELTIPSTAGPSDPRIVLDTNDPLSAGINDAAISFYWDDSRGYVLGVERSGAGPTAVGQLRIYGRIPDLESPTGQGLSQLIELTYAPDSPDSDGVALRGGTRVDKPAEIGVRGSAVDLGGTSVSDEAGRDVRVFGRSIPRGLVDVGGFTAVGGITTAETVAATLSYAFALSGARRYRAEFIGRVSSTVAGDRVRVKIRRTDTAGVTELDIGEVTIDAACPINAWCYVTGSGADGDKFVLTLQRTAGTGTITYTPQESGLMDIGPADVT